MFDLMSIEFIYLPDTSIIKGLSNSSFIHKIRFEPFAVFDKP